VPHAVAGREPQLTTKNNCLGRRVFETSAAAYRKKLAIDGEIENKSHLCVSNLEGLAKLLFAFGLEHVF